MRKLLESIDTLIYSFNTTLLLHSDPKASEELAPRSLRDKIIQSFYASLD